MRAEARRLEQEAKLDLEAREIEAKLELEAREIQAKLELEAHKMLEEDQRRQAEAHRIRMARELSAQQSLEALRSVLAELRVHLHLNLATSALRLADFGAFVESSLCLRAAAARGAPEGPAATGGGPQRAGRSQGVLGYAARVSPRQRSHASGGVRGDGREVH
jgi:hypothetical protein